MSSAHFPWFSVESTGRPMLLTRARSNSGLIRATSPSSMVQIGVESFGCEKENAHELPIRSWKRISPSVVSASKSGAVSPSCSPIVAVLFGRRIWSADTVRSGDGQGTIQPRLDQVMFG